MDEKKFEEILNYICDFKTTEQFTARFSPVSEYVREHPAEAEEVFAEVRKWGTRLSRTVERKLIAAAEKLAAEDNMLLWDTVCEAFPQNCKAAMYKEQKEDIQSILSSDKLDLYSLNVCMRINKKMVRHFLQTDEKLLAKVDKMLDNPKYFYRIEALHKSGDLDGVLDMDEKIAQVQKNFNHLSGGVVFDILRGKQYENDIKEVEKYDKVLKLLQDYYKQTRYLSNYRDKDLFHTEYHQKPNGDYLELIGKFKDYPEVEKLVEEKVGKLYSYFSYPMLSSDRDADKRYQKIDRFSYVCTEGGDKFAENMKKELLKDVSSPESAFYIKYAADVLSQYDCEERYALTVTEIIPQIIDKHPDVCETLIGAMKQERKYHVVGAKTTERIVKELCEHPDSAVSKFYLEHLGDLYKGDNDGGATLYIWSAAEILRANKAEHPEICEKITDYMAALIEEEKDDYKHIYGDYDGFSIAHYIESLADAYAVYPTEKLKTLLNEGAAHLEASEENITTYAAVSEQTGLKTYDKLIYDALSKKTDNHVRLCNLKEGIEYTGALVILEEAKTKTLEFYHHYAEPEYVFDCAKLTGNTSLTKILLSSACSDKLQFVNADKLLQLPDLREININLNEEEAHKLYKSLMKHKPRNLHRIGANVKFSDKEVNNLMTKYYDLSIDGVARVFIHMRNAAVIATLDGTYCLSEAASEGVLADYLSVLPPEERPSFKQLSEKDKKTGKSPLEVLREPASGYYDKLLKVADVIGDEKVKTQVELRKLVKEGKLIEFLQNSSAEQWPKLESLCWKSPIFDNETIFDLLRKDEDKLEVLKIMQVSDQDIAKLGDTKSMGEAVDQWLSQQKAERDNATAQAAFKAWQESRGINKK